MSLRNREIYEFGPFRLDVGEHVFQRLDGAESGSLPDKSFQTLIVLIRNRGRLVSKQELIDAVWPDTIVEENNLDKCIHHIRHVLCDSPSDPKFVQTVRKHGYRFVAEVRETDEPLRPPTTSKAQGVDAEGHGNGTNPSSPSIGQASPATDARVLRDVRESRRYEFPVPASQITASGQHALVDVSDWRKAAGRLGSENDPRVTNNRTQQELEQARSGPPAAASAGSRRQGRVTRLLTPAAVLLGALVIGGWYVSGNRQTAENQLLTGSTGPAKPSTEIHSPDQARSRAYDLYMRGKVKVGSENREDTEIAISLLEEAIALDPTLAGGHAQLARGYNTMGFKYSSGAESKRFHENAEVAIEKALDLNPDLAEAHLARGLILWTDTKGFPHEQAIQSYKRSLALDPNQDETHHQLSLVYSHIGLLDKASESVKKALELDPNNTLARYRASVYVAYQGKYEEALAMYKTVPRDFTPLIIDRTIAEALIQTGRLSEAEAIADDYLRRFPQDEGGSFTSVKALLLAKAGNEAAAREAIDRAARIGKGFGHFHHTAYNIASAYSALNKPEEAVEWLEKAAENGFPNYPLFETDPNLDGIRKDQQFISFMAKLKQRWEQFKTLA